MSRVAGAGTPPGLRGPRTSPLPSVFLLPTCLPAEAGLLRPRRTRLDQADLGHLRGRDTEPSLLVAGS